MCKPLLHGYENFVQTAKYFYLTSLILKPNLCEGKDLVYLE